MARLHQVTKDETSFVNNFWDENDLGYKRIVTRVKNSIITMEELLEFYLERINIEKEYSKKLDKLNLLSLGTYETGVLKKSLNKLNYENQEMIKYNNKFIRSVNQINYDKLNHFYMIYNKRTKKILGHMNKLVDKKADILKDLSITKERYKDNCSSIKSLTLSIQTTWGKELEKNEKMLQKLNYSLANSESNYKISLDNFSKINEIFKRDYVLALKEIYQLEIERIQLIKINCFNFCNNIATLCVDNDQSVDMARSFFAKISPPQDLQDFSNNYGTGNQILTDPKFVDFMQGLDDESDKQFEVAEFENPEFSHLLSRSYSTYSHATQNTQQTQATDAANGQPANGQPANSQKLGLVQSSGTPTITESEFNSPFNTPSPIKFANKFANKLSPKAPKFLKSPTSPKPQEPEKLPKTPHSEPLQKFELPKPEDDKSNYSNSNNSPDEKTDIFSVKSNNNQFNDSNGSSNYSNPTNYSSNSSERNWASPRKKEQQLNQFQEKINLKSKELPALSMNKSTTNDNNKNSPTRNKTPIMKDFSIDFIAKALEDLNSGGNGDVDQYRRSVRLSKQYDLEKSNTTHNTPYYNRHQHEHEDDHNEVPRRYDTINFKSPSMNRSSAQYQDQLNGSPTRKASRDPRRPKSMYDSYSFDPARSVDPKRTLLKTPTRSFNNLNSMINKITPINKKPYITKAKARYAYKPQHHGELFFRKNWNIYVIHRQPDNWYLCELGDNCEDKVGLVGLVPGNYVIEGDDVF